jgi:hypothetical protein
LKSLIFNRALLTHYGPPKYRRVNLSRNRYEEPVICHAHVTSLGHLTSDIGHPASVPSFPSVKLIEVIELLKSVPLPHIFRQQVHIMAEDDGFGLGRMAKIGDSLECIFPGL